MWSDNETDVDLLDFRHLVDAVYSIVANPRLLPTTIGVYGDWGSGKSSLLRMAKTRIEDELNGAVCISFNGWLFEGYDDAKAALMQTILEEIKEKQTIDAQANAIFSRLLRRINWMRVLWTAGKYAAAYHIAGQAGVGAALATDVEQGIRNIAQSTNLSVEKVQEIFHGDKAEQDDDLHVAIRDFHKEFASLLESADIKTLVVFIDDLDRCNPDTIIETLEAIRLFLYAPNTVFIIGADERLVKYAVRRRFPELPGENVEVGRDYLEKLIQFPIRVPPLGSVELETYINLLFAQISNLDAATFEKVRAAAIQRANAELYRVTLDINKAQELLHELPKPLEEGLSIAGYITPVLVSGLYGNPRQTKRFLNTLLMRRNMAQSRGIQLEVSVLAKLMLLEYFKDESFRDLAQLQAEQAGFPQEIKLLEQGEEEETDRDLGSKSTVKHAKQLVISTWKADQWLVRWVEMEPKLSGHDLRPYFFFSKDILGAMSGSVKRLSPQAQEILASVIGESDVVRRAALEKVKNLNDGDLGGLFEALTTRVKSEEDERRKNHILEVLISVVEVRKELLSQLVAFLAKVPVAQLSFTIVPKLKHVTNAGAFEAMGLEILKQWSTNTSNPGLAAAASNELKPNKK